MRMLAKSVMFVFEVSLLSKQKRVNQKIAINCDQITARIAKGKAFNSINGGGIDGIPCNLVNLYLCWSPCDDIFVCLVEPKRQRIRR